MNEPTDPHKDQTYIFSAKNADGSFEEVEMTAAQALDLGAGKAIAYFPHDERLSIRDDGTIVHRQSAVPLDPAA